MLIIPTSKKSICFALCVPLWLGMLSTLVYANGQSLSNNHSLSAQKQNGVDVSQLQLDTQLFVQRKKSYKRVTNVYVTEAQATQPSQNTNTTTTQALSASQNLSVSSDVIARKGPFVIKRVVALSSLHSASAKKGANDKTAQKNGDAQKNKAVLLNTTNNNLAILSPHILVGVNSQVQAEAITSRHKVTLVKLLGRGSVRVAIYSVALDDALSITTTIRENEPVRFADADIVEHFPLSQ